jgi:hypothetical protein
MISGCSLRKMHISATLPVKCAAFASLIDGGDSWEALPRRLTETRALAWIPV